MKYLIVIIFIVSSINTKLQAQSSLNSGLVVCMPFNANGRDLSGLDNNGELIGAPQFVADRTGKSNSAIQINGTSQYVRFRSEANLESIDWSFSVWLNSSLNGGAHQNILNRTWIGDGSDGVENTMSLFLLGDNEVVMYYNDNANADYPISEYNFTNYRLPRGVFKMITATKDNDIITLYSDTLRIARYTINQNLNPNVNNAYWYLGSEIDLGRIWVPYKGVLDDLKMWDRPISKAEVKELFMTNPNLKIRMNQASACSSDSVTAENLNGFSVTWSFNRSGIPIEKTGTKFKFQPSDLAREVFCFANINCQMLSDSLFAQTLTNNPIKFQMDSVFCSSDAPIQLKANPEGGTFFGRNVRGNKLILPNDKESASLVTYTVFAPCLGSDTITITQKAPVELPLNLNLKNAYCANIDRVSLLDTLESLVYTGDAIDGVYFYPKLAKNDITKIKYSYKIAGCNKYGESEIAISGKVSIPNIITVNNDVVNDKFEVPGILSDGKIELYNRWGKKVFNSSLTSTGVEIPLDAGTYFYKLDLNGDTECKINQVGWLEIVK